MGLNVSVDNNCILTAQVPAWPFEPACPQLRATPQRPQRRSISAPPGPAEPQAAAEELPPPGPAETQAAAEELLPPGPAEPQEAAEELLPPGPAEPQEPELPEPSALAIPEIPESPALVTSVLPELRKPAAPELPVTPDLTAGPRRHKWPVGCLVSFVTFSGARLDGHVGELDGFCVTGRTTDPQSWLRIAAAAEPVTAATSAEPEEPEWVISQNCTAMINSRGVHFKAVRLVKANAKTSHQIGETALKGWQGEALALAQCLHDSITGAATWTWDPLTTEYTVESCEPCYTIWSDGEMYRGIPEAAINPRG